MTLKGFAALFGVELPLRWGDNKESRMKKNMAWILVLSIPALASSAGAQIVKCTNAEGDVTYADVPCQRAEKVALVDTRASSNIVDHSSIRAQKGRVFAAVAAPVYSAPSAPSSPAPPPAPFTVDRQTRPVSYTR